MNVSTARARTLPNSALCPASCRSREVGGKGRPSLPLLHQASPLRHLEARSLTRQYASDCQHEDHRTRRSTRCIEPIMRPLYSHYIYCGICTLEVRRGHSCKRHMHKHRGPQQSPPLPRNLAIVFQGACESMLQLEPGTPSTSRGGPARDAGMVVVARPWQGRQRKNTSRLY